jgi:hypothetical protein
VYSRDGIDFRSEQPHKRPLTLHDGWIAVVRN